MKPETRLKHIITRMGKFRINRIILLFIASVATASSCEQEEVEYGGITGAYTCIEASAHSGYRNYIVEIEKVNNQSGLFIILNFHNTGINEFLYAEYSGDSIYITDQVTGSLFINGKGKVYSDFRRMEINYRTNDGVTELDYQAVFER